MLSFQDYNPADLNRVLENSQFRRAIQVASLSLYRELEKRSFCLDKLTDRQKLSVFKYYNRMSFRPTPFGLFASFSFIPWQPTNTRIERFAKCQAHWCLDYRLNVYLSSVLLKTKAVQGMTFYVNSSLYELDNEYRYIKRFQKAGGKRDAFQIMSLDKSTSLAKLLDFCAEPKTYHQLSKFIRSESGNDNETEVIGQLVQSQMLYSSLHPNVTGENYLMRILKDFKLNKASDSLVTDLESLFVFLKKSKSGTSGIYEFFATLPVSSIVPLGINQQPFHTVSIMKHRGGLSASLQNNISDALKCLNTLSSPEPLKALTDFRKKFVLRFQGSEVPLLKALDPQCGISYLKSERAQDTMRLNNLFKPKTAPGSRKLFWTAVNRLLLEKMMEAKKGRPMHITLHDHDIARLPSINAETYPASISVMFQQTDQGIYLEHAGGVSAINLPARFSFDDEVHTHLNEIEEKERIKNSEVIFAEIAYYDNSATDNINTRGHVRPYEIPVLTHSDRHSKSVIPLSDLVVSVVDNSVVLRSKTLNKEILPTLGSAYNYRLSNLPVFNFLADLQYQDVKADFNFNPANYLPDLSHYPRISYKNTILYPETWVVDKSQLLGFQAVESGMLAFQRFSREVNLSRYFALCSHDHQLVFDLNSATEVLNFLKIISGKARVIIKEFFNAKTSQASTDQNHKKYITQYIASLTNNKPAYTSKSFQGEHFSNVDAVNFLPGEEWLYYKIYVHPETANFFLSGNLLEDLINILKSTGKLRSWFFVRYTDPETHFRLRFQFAESAIGQSSPYLTNRLKHLVRCGLIVDYSICTYRREVERYKLARMSDVETYFQLSSEAVLALYRTMDSVADKERYKLIFALVSVDKMLGEVIPELSSRQLYLQSIYESLVQNVNVEVTSFRDLDKFYRSIRPDVEQAAADPIMIFGATTSEKLNLQSAKFAILNKELTNVGKGHHLRFIADLLHMHLNRIFSADSIKQEMLCYYFLTKLYASWLAKAKQRHPASQKSN